MQSNVTHVKTKEDFIFNVTVESFVVLHDIKVHIDSYQASISSLFVVFYQIFISIAIPLTKDDSKFAIEFPTLLVDLCNFQKRIALDVVYRKVVEFFMDKFDDGPLVCPLAPHVNNQPWVKQLAYSYHIKFQHIKRISNNKLSSFKLPRLVANTRFKIVLKLVGKTPSIKKILGLCDAVITGEIKRS